MTSCGNSGRYARRLRAPEIQKAGILDCSIKAATAKKSGRLCGTIERGLIAFAPFYLGPLDGMTDEVDLRYCQRWLAR